MVDAEIIGRRVAQRRHERGWDQSELGRRSGVSSSYISRLESGAYARPSVERLGALASALGCRVIDLTEATLPDDASELEAQLYALGYRPDEAPQVERIARTLAGHPPDVRRRLLAHIAEMLDLIPQ